MELLTISRVSRMFGVSTRTLRYYEQIGLLPSIKMEDYAYRAYDAAAIARLGQIIVLRKLRIPLKQISMIFENADAKTMLDVFTQSISEIDDEITALSTMRLILENFVDRLRHKAGVSMEYALHTDEIMLAALNSLSLTKINFKEERSMNDLNKANEVLTRLKNVRIVQLPPFTVVSSHFFGENPEVTSGGPILKFMADVKLYEIKPDARMFGFNCPCPSDDKELYGYETWVTIPDDMEVPSPLVKKHFSGGLYATYTIKFGNFHEWNDFVMWIENHDMYEANYSKEGEENMNGCLEEHLNWVYAAHLGWPEHLIDDNGQLDLLLPIKLKK